MNDLTNMPPPEAHPTLLSRRSLMWAATVAVAAAILGCGGKDGHKANATTTQGASALYTDKEDRTLSSYVGTAGTYYYQGEKDSEGMPTAVTNAILVPKGQNSLEHAIFFDYDSQSRLIRSSGEVGTLEVDYQDDGSLALRITAPSGDSVQFPYAQGRSITLSRFAAPRGVEKASVKYIGVPPAQRKTQPRDEPATTRSGVIRVTCGGEPFIPAYNAITMTGGFLGDSGGSQVLNPLFVSVVQTGATEFTYTVPQYNRPSDYERYKTLLAARYAGACNAKGVPLLESTIDNATSVQDALKGLITDPFTLKTFYDIFKELSLSLKDALCLPVLLNDLTYLFVYENRNTLNLKFQARLGTVASNSITFEVEPGGDIPMHTIDLNVPPNLRLSAIDANPRTPTQGQSYVFFVNLFCVPSGGRVRMSITGTDGYYNTSEQLITGDGVYQLYVPGAEQGVVDTVRATVLDLDGSTLIGPRTNTVTFQ